MSVSESVVDSNELTLQDSQKEMNTLRKATFLPNPVGYRMLVAPVKVEQTRASGLYLPDNAVERENVATIVAFVIKQGPDCYVDTKRFPSGPWCKEGDFVVLKSYSGIRIVVKGQEVRIINDDSIEAVVEDPRLVMRAS